MGASASRVGDPPPPITSVSFSLNGRKVTLKGACPLLSLNDWLRVQPGLTGTKKMCSEGGCGCCVVTVATDDAIIAINSVSCKDKSSEKIEMY